MESNISVESKVSEDSYSSSLEIQVLQETKVDQSEIELRKRDEIIKNLNSEISNLKENFEKLSKENKFKYEGMILSHLDNIKKLEEDKRALESNIEKLNEEKQKLENEKLALKNQISMMNDEEHNFEKIKKNLNDQFNKVFKENQKIKEKNQSLENHCIDLRNENEQEQIKISEYLKAAEEINKKYESFKENLKNLLGCKTVHEDDLLSEIQSLQSEFLELSTKYQKFERHDNMLEKIKESENLLQTSPWKLEKLKIDYKDYLTIYENNNSSHFEITFTNTTWNFSDTISTFLKDIEISKTFGILGSSQCGKTFLLSKLSNSIQKLGKTCPTKGLQFDHFELNNNNFLSIDSAGLFQPVSFSDLKFKEKTLKDQLMINLVSSLSRTIILVVNNFGLFEQKMILDCLSRTAKSTKNFLIVHNFKDLFEPEELPGIWKKEIQGLYEENISQRSLEKIQKMIVKNQELSKKISFFFKKNPYFKKGLTHVALINDNYQQGKEYNSFVFEFIKKYLVYENTGKPINDFKSFLCKKVKKCTGEDIEFGDEKIFMNFRESFDFLSFMNRNWSRSSDMIKKFVDMKISDGKLFLSFDLPGVSDDINIICLNGLTRLTTLRPDDGFQLKSDSKIRFGESTLEFKIPKEFNHLEPKAELKNGRLEIVYETFKEKLEKVRILEC